MKLEKLYLNQYLKNWTEIYLKKIKLPKFLFIKKGLSHPEFKKIKLF